MASCIMRPLGAVARIGRKECMATADSTRLLTELSLTLGPSKAKRVLASLFPRRDENSIAAQGRLWPACSLQPVTRAHLVGSQRGEPRASLKSRHAALSACLGYSLTYAAGDTGSVLVPHKHRVSCKLLIM